MSFRFADVLLMLLLRYGLVQKIEIVVDSQIDNPTYSPVIDCRKVFKSSPSKEKPEVVKILGEKTFHLVLILSILSCDRVISSHILLVMRWVRKPGANYNPLFIYSEVGLWKTHLLQWTALEIKRNSRQKVVYLTSDQFVTDYVNAVKDRKIDQMRARFRAIDVLLMDDVQFWLAKRALKKNSLHFSIFSMMLENKSFSVLISHQKNSQK